MVSHMVQFRIFELGKLNLFRSFLHLLLPEDEKIVCTVYYSIDQVTLIR